MLPPLVLSVAERRHLYSVPYPLVPRALPAPSCPPFVLVVVLLASTTRQPSGLSTMGGPSLHGAGRQHHAKVDTVVFCPVDALCLSHSPYLPLLEVFRGSRLPPSTHPLPSPSARPTAGAVQSLWPCRGHEASRDGQQAVQRQQARRPEWQRADRTR